MSELIEFLDIEFEKALLDNDFRKQGLFGKKELSELQMLKLKLLFKQGVLAHQVWESRGFR